MSSSVLTRSEAAVLSAVAQQGTATPLEIPRLTSLTLSETRNALGKLRERHLLEPSSDNGAEAYFTPTRSGIEAIGQLRHSSASVLSYDIVDDAFKTEEELDSALETAMADL